ncbi:hypothetical protein [Chryseobacterium sp. JM1]|uniref:hypothetical protein n=1 Tax=Chryseobacterium sp. JM1 TaxID=1233950 RepID=UPI0004E75FB3|nr:hypothetical protein [Chryseobacterium sp. JM1]KFF21977.1 hypothetical protein IW22_08630 [Chryseobacterium sp. JM1]
MTERKTNIIEGIGLILILFSFLIQLIETDIESQVREAQFAQTQIKLDNLWVVISDDYSEKHPEQNLVKAIDIKNMDENWKYYSISKDDLSKWENSVLFQEISKLRIWFFILGSLIIVIPKFWGRKS